MYQAEGASITAGDYGMASDLGDPSARADRAMPETAARRGARSRVLVVDDEPEIVAHLREVFEGLGYEVSSARDGREALERVAAQQPDLILLDSVMPGMDGVAVCQALNHTEVETPLAIHIGINSGGAYVGSTHFEGRRGTRWTFTASGLVTAVAARLAGLAQDGQIVAGPETVRRLGDRYHLEPVGAVRLKNVTEPVEAQRIFRPSSSY